MDVTEMRQLILAELADVHTTLPGVIVDYDGTRATVRPVLDKLLSSGEVLPAPQIVNVPLCWPVGMSGKAMVTVPLQPGDTVKLSFCERALESWLAGTDGAPDDPRYFDLSDAIATPLLRPGIGVADRENVCLKFNDCSIKLTPDGGVLVTGSQVIVDAPICRFTGDIDVTGEATVSGIAFTPHVHDKVQSGNGKSGTPVK